MATTAPHRDSLVERGARHDRRIILISLIAVVVPCWIWIAAMSLDMYGRMTGPSAWSMSAIWGWQHTFLLFAMWAAMMTGMMLPSVTPVLLLYARVVRSSAEGHDAPARLWLLGAGYTAVWIAFSGAATLLQRWLMRSAVLTPMMELEGERLAAAALLLAGAYQLTPLKGRCLSGCRSAAGVISAYWRSGRRGAFHMGALHGAYCLGCCWALMLMLFAGGIMNLAVIAGITGLVLVEKLAPWGDRFARWSGLALIAAALIILA